MIPFADSKRQYNAMREEISSAVGDVFSNGWFILGKELESFEREFAAYCGVRHAIGVGSGTEALHLALVALGIGRGDEVITVPNTAVFTVSAISFAGATSVFADIRPDSYTIDPWLVESLITSRTKAILPVHLYGQCADMDALNAVARKHGIPVIEDACQAHGATDNGRRAGSMGVAGCFSFYPSKNLGAYGDGGMITTDDAMLADKLRMLRNGGQRERYYHEIKGFNSRLDEIQAAVLRKKLGRLDSWNLRRNEIAQRYRKGIVNPLLKQPEVLPGKGHVFHLYVVRCERRDELKNYLEKRGVQTLIHYPVPVHLQKAYADLKQREGACPAAESCARQILSLPLYPELTDAELEKIIEAINEFK